jgi:hypothetical protein
MRDIGDARAAGLLPRLSLQATANADEWPDDLRLSDVEERFTCSVCGKRGADVRPDFNWNKTPVRMMGYP